MNEELLDPVGQDDTESVANMMAAIDSQEGIGSTAVDTALDELIMKEGRRQDGEVLVKLTEEQIKEKHDKFHEVYREQVLDNLEFGELRKNFNLRKKTREADMQQLDNCILRGEENQCITRWRIPAHKLKGFMPDLDGAEEALIFDSDFNLIDRVPLTEMERQMQIEYEDSTGASAPDDVAEAVESDEAEEVLIDGSDDEHIVGELVVPENSEKPKYFTPFSGYA